MAGSIRRESTPGGAVRDQVAESHRLIVADCLLRSGHITRGQREEAAEWLNGRPQGFVTEFLLKRNYIESDTVATVLSRQYGFPAVNLDGLEVPPDILAAMPYELAKKYMAVPYGKTGDKLYLAMLEPANRRMLEELSARLGGCQPMPGAAGYQAIIDAFKRLYGISDDEYRRFSEPLDLKDAADRNPFAADGLGALISGARAAFAFGEAEAEDDSGDDSPAGHGAVMNLANQILIQAVSEGASDVHVEPFENQFQVRYRIDGVLYKRTSLPLELKNALIARLKSMARLDLTERRAPQDGRLRLRLNKREIDFRVSSLPTIHGESVVLRLLDRTGPRFDLGGLGLTPKNLDQVRSAVSRPSGLFLVAGPAGSGRTTTLYSCLSLRNTDDAKILTAEDPVEFSLPGVHQVNVARNAGLTFAAALKAFLGQDPDVCLIGEIRDPETGRLAVEAALTGRLVLSALHAADAPAAITRLVDMGVSARNLAASLSLCSAQRLLRRLCPHCRQPVTPPPADQLVEAGFDRNLAGAVQLYEGRGCPHCNGSGYKGRLGVFEVMEMTPALAEAVASGVPESRLRQLALREGMSTLRQDGLLKASQGLTTLAQVLEKTARPREILETSFENGGLLRLGPDRGPAAPPFPPPGQTRAPAPKVLAAADSTALRLTAAEAPKARELKSA
ncbi:MAG: Flp pilus assembly complex ATPase component TadA [Candidatus Adiutrix sp.]|jgi:type IV pilus assembly protein PilB|nr:Flp pilus assembly complex ATPase component TadA [Candidatus Adiutrix sp.]